MKPNQRKAFSNEDKAALLEAYKSCEKTQKAWCEDNDVSLSTLQRWLSKSKPQAIQNWLPIVAAAPVKSNGIEIQVGKCNIPINRQADLTLLADVLKVLIEVC